MKEISFTSENIIDAINNESDKFARQKLQAILLLKENNSPKMVALKLSVCLATVYNWVNQINSEGLQNLKIKNGRGLKSLLTDDQLIELKSHISNPIKTPDGYNRGWQSKDVREYIFKKYNVKYSLRRIQELLNKMGFKKIVCRPRSKRRNEKLTEEFLTNVKKNETYWVKDIN